MGADQVGNGADIFANCRRGAPSADSIQAAPQAPVLNLFVSDFRLINILKSTKRKYTNNRYLEPE